MTRTAIYPGSFDPVTRGHEDIIRRSTRLADRVIVAVAVNIGNPHAVFFVSDCEAVELADLGPRLEHHPLFPERANIGVATVIDRGHIRLRVWERGVGTTSACGSGACAAAVAAARRDLAEHRSVVVMDGGPVAIEWQPEGHVSLTGPVATSFHGELAP